MVIQQSCVVHPQGFYTAEMLYPTTTVPERQKLCPKQASHLARTRTRTPLVPSCSITIAGHAKLNTMCISEVHTGGHDVLSE